MLYLKCQFSYGMSSSIVSFLSRNVLKLYFLMFSTVVCFLFLLKQNVFALKLQYKEPPLPSPPPPPPHTHIHTLQYLART